MGGALGVNDHALVVGINRYPELTPLEGPEADADAFASWLIADPRVAVPAGQVTKMLSSSYPAVATARDAKPIVADINAALEAHIDRADRNGGIAGNRLYLYFAGHGMATDADEVALLMANAARRRTGHHVPGRAYTRWFREANMFREIMLFMDCCREPHLTAPVNPPPWDRRLVMGTTSYLFGFATSWPSGARETASKPGGQVRGLFTQALVDALKGGIAPNASGEVTASMLEGYLLDYFGRLYEQSQDRIAERQEPKIESDPKDAFVILYDIAAVQPRREIVVRIQRRDGGAAADIRVADHTGTFQQGIANDGTMEIKLAQGLYKATAPGNLTELFEVSDEEGPIDVTV
jgi:uncharacterized caspase-like protein